MATNKVLCHVSRLAQKAASPNCLIKAIGGVQVVLKGMQV